MIQVAIPSLLVEGFTDEQGRELRDACTAAAWTARAEILAAADRDQS